MPPNTTDPGAQCLMPQAESVGARPQYMHKPLYVNLPPKCPSEPIKAKDELPIATHHRTVQEQHPREVSEHNNMAEPASREKIPTRIFINTKLNGTNRQAAKKQPFLVQPASRGHH